MRINYSNVPLTVVTPGGVYHAPPTEVRQQSGGVGTELLNHGLMRAVKWVLGSRCDCRKKAAEWDALGIEWFESHIDDEVIPHLRSTAARFGLPWSEEIARRVIRVAVCRAKRKRRAPRG
jgi:hypothetical protein